MPRETPALPVIWSLARHGVPVTVASKRRVCTGLFSRHPVRKLVYPDPKHDENGFVEWLLAELKGGNYAVTLGCGEDITYMLALHRERLTEYTSIPVVDLDTFMTCRDKSLTMKAAEACGVPIPTSWYPEDVGDEEAARQATYPAVVKPCISNGARGISFVDGPQQLVERLRTTRESFGPCLVQEYIPHDDGLQLKAELLLDRESRVRMWGAYAKLRYYPPSGGSSTLNQTVRRDEILEHSARLLTHIGWQGMGDCDYIVDPRDGVAKLMEVNPRFTRTIRVLVEAGLDYPYELYRLALGETPREVLEYETDVFLRYLPADVVWFLKSDERFKTRPSFFRFFGSKLHYEEWSLGDPLTGFGFWGSLLIDMLNPATRKHRLR